jgi:hypothetical protein
MSEFSLENLKNCESATKGLLDVVTRNQVLTDFNSDQNKYWGAAHKVWKERKANAEKQMSDWDNNTGVYSDFQNTKNAFLNEERLYKNCVLWTDVRNQNDCTDDFGRGWSRVPGSEEQYSCIWSQGKSKCKRTTRKAEDDFDLWKTNQDRKRPTFNEPEPIEKKGDFYHKELEVYPTVAINCCANIMNISAENVTDNAQSCQQSISQKIEQAQQAQEQQNQGQQQPQNQGQQQPQTQGEQQPQNQGEQEPQNQFTKSLSNDENKKNIILVIVLCILLIFMFVIASAVFALM